MKKAFIICIFILAAAGAQAQVQAAKLQASGLTCSMCSKAVLNALQKVSFVKAVDVAIDKQEYDITFKQGSAVNIDALSKAVEDAGFSVSRLYVTAAVAPQKLEQDKHISIGGQTFHFLNAKGQQLPQVAQFKVVDKSFVTAKEYKKYSGLSKMPCVQTGKMETCCAKNTAASNRVYHVVL
jgi:copper chaperone CopZ